MAKKAKGDSNKRDGLGAAKARVAGYGLLEEADRLADEYGKDEKKAWALKYAFYRVRDENKKFFAPKFAGKTGLKALTKFDKRLIRDTTDKGERETLVKILLKTKGKMSPDEIKRELQGVIADALKA